MAIGRSEDRDNPRDPLVLRHHGNVRDPISVTHLGQRSFDRTAMTRLLCMRLGTGQPGATLVTCILRDGSPRTQADMWSRMGVVRGQQWTFGSFRMPRPAS